MSRTIVLTYISGDCGGLFILSCCLQKKLNALQNITFIEKRIERHTNNNDEAKDKGVIVATTQNGGDCKRSEHNQTPSSTHPYPRIECHEADLSVCGVLLSLYALDALVPSTPLLSLHPITSIKQRAHLNSLHEFHRLLSVLAAAHGRFQVTKSHGRLSAMTFSSPEDAVSKQNALHLLETELLQQYETDVIIAQETPEKEQEKEQEELEQEQLQKTPKNQNDISIFATTNSSNPSTNYLFWLLYANYITRNDESFMTRYPNLMKWMDTKGKEQHIEIILSSNDAMMALKQRFIKTMTSSTGGRKSKKNSISSLNTDSPLTTAIAQLQLLSSSLHLTSKHEAILHSVLKNLTRGENVLNVNVVKMMDDNKITLDKDTESWMRAELQSNNDTASSSQESASIRTRTKDQDDVTNNSNGNKETKNEMKPHDVLGITLPSGGDLIFDSLINKKIGTWELDILGEYEQLQKKPLFYICLAATHRDGLLDQFAQIHSDNTELVSLSTSLEAAPVKNRFVNFIIALEEKYIASNSYHNNCHAADVVNSMVCLLADGKSELDMTVLQRMTAIIAAAAHDVAHTGQNNGYHNKYVTKYAIEYSNQSTMEMLHLSTTFKILNKDSCNIFQHMSRNDTSICRKLMIEMILATDLSKHFDLINNYSIDLDKDGIVSQDKLLEIVLKAADIGHAVKSIPIHQKWSLAISEEFYIQGDLEREKGDEPPTFMDRNAANLAKSQIGFIKVIVTPMYVLCARILPNATSRMEQIEKTMNFWENEALKDDEKKKKENNLKE